MGVMSYQAVANEDSAGRDKSSETPVRPKRLDNRLTEDDIAREKLGGPKGSAELEPAPLTRQERVQNSPNDDPGHVA